MKHRSCIASLKKFRMRFMAWRYLRILEIAAQEDVAKPLYRV
jgi:hypothetical protein